MTEDLSKVRTQGWAGPRSRFMLAAGLLVVVVTIGVGIFAASNGLRLPFMRPKSTRVAVVLSQTINTKGIDAGVAQYRSLREQGFPGLSESESDMNDLGYQLLRKGREEDAIQVFQLNVETHPKSANVYDSLGEAYAAAGKKEPAIANYRKALAINPNLASATRALQRLGSIPAKSYSPLLLLHICAGTLGFLSGAVAISLRKGSRRHGLVGNVFVISMLCLSSTGVYLALTKSQMSNVFGGVLTFYLVATAWMTARRRDGEKGIFEWGGFLAALAVGATIVTYGFQAANSQTGTTDGIPAGMYFFLGSIALLAAAGDLRILVRGGLFGPHRIARHLWRMCFALFIATASIFLARPHLFPAVLRETGVLFAVSIMPLILMTFWLVRVLFTKAYKRRASLRENPGALYSASPNDPARPVQVNRKHPENASVRAQQARLLS